MPQPGAQAPTGYIYLDVPFSLVRQQAPDFTWFASVQPYLNIEHFAKGRCVTGTYLRDFIDRSRVYRFPNTALNHFTPDKCNPGEFYLDTGRERIPVLTTDPSIGRTPVREWTPLG